MMQGTVLTCRSTFSFKVNGRGHIVIFSAGQQFWVTNSEVNQQSTGVIRLARLAKGSSATNYDFSSDQITELFTTQNPLGAQ